VSTTVSTGMVVVVLVVGLAVLGLLVVLGRARERRQRRGGFARRRDIGRALSPQARQQGINRLRPGLPADLPPAEYGIALGRAVHTRQRLWASFEETVGLIAPPRAGKSGTLAGAVIDAPGAVLVTGIRADVYEHSYRRRRGRGPLAVLNPEGVGGITSTFRWDLVAGCDDPAVAQRRAGALLSGSPATAGSEDRSFWESQSYQIIRSYLYAAAVSGADMRSFHRWVTSPRDRRPLEVLEATPGAPGGWADEVGQVLNDTAEKTRQSIFNTVAPTFGFMGIPAVAEAVTPKPGEPSFDVDDLLDQNGTLYLLGQERKYGGIAPLFSCLTNELYECAQARASRSALGRLDPPLLLVLDEVATICPVELDRWTSTAGGFSIPLLYGVQSPSQLYERWGQLAGQTIWSNTTVKAVFGGLSNAEYLRELSELCGDRDEPVVTTSRDRWGAVQGRSATTRRVPVMTVGDIRTLPDWRALVVHRNLPPVLTDITPVWERRP
jgi:type IV secretion system protein VirD4